ncbi:MAG: NAD-dependent epimerase/dehydratase family protein [Acidobacteriaceae bacterium]
MPIETEEQLEEKLAQPSPADVVAMRALDGDIIVLGVGGKMGPSLVRLLRRAANEAGVKKKIVAVARFTDKHLPTALQADGIETIACDLLEDGALDRLPEMPNVIFMAARKFGTTGSEYLTWAMNTQLPALVASRYRKSKVVCFSSGNVYPLRPIQIGGTTEESQVDPQGEYAQSVLGRERIFEYGSHRWGTPVALLRLNYAIDLRYGVLSDIGTAVYQRQPVDVRMPVLNVIWQRDANSVCFRTFAHCQSPPFVLNLTGPETLSTRWIAEEFGKYFGCAPIFAGEETSSALLSNAAKQQRLFGYPTVTPSEMIEWTAHWIASGNRNLNKPTHFQTRDGKF